MASATTDAQGQFVLDAEPGQYLLCLGDDCAPAEVAGGWVRADYCVCLNEGWAIQ